MKKCMVIPDSFKGTISAIEVCQIMEKKIKEYFPSCEILSVPVADGGEGTLDCFLYALQGERVEVTVAGPYGEPLNCHYARIGDTAIIEMAQAAGLPLVEGHKNPAETTTYGVGELMRHAVEYGASELIIGLGGSCTNDGGTGMAAALGVVFCDEFGNSFIPTGNTLEQIRKIDVSATQKLLNGCKISAMCYIDNPMFGKTGAAYIFGPQKGADEEMVVLLDRNLIALSNAIEHNLGISVASLSGAGAAGAMGAGVAAFLGGELKPGIQSVLDMIHFETLLDGTELVFTGEGKLDGQSLRGKVVIGISRRAAKQGIPVIAVVGDIGDDAAAAYDMGVSAIFSTNRQAIPFEKAKGRSKQDLEATMDSILRFRRCLSSEKYS